MNASRLAPESRYSNPKRLFHGAVGFKANRPFLLQMFPEDDFVCARFVELPDTCLSDEIICQIETSGRLELSGAHCLNDQHPGVDVGQRRLEILQHRGTHTLPLTIRQDPNRQ